MRAEDLIGIPVGTRVNVRHLIEDGERATDALGELVAADASTVTVDTRRGPETIELTAIVVAKVVPPPPVRGWRVASFLRRARVAVLDLDGVLRTFDTSGELARAERELVGLVEELRYAGTEVFVFTNGTDRVPEKLEHMGLGHLVPRLLNAHDLGWAKPAPEAYAVAHAEIEARLGRTVGRGEVVFTDDRPANVDAARIFGWRARVFTHPGG